MIERRTIGEFRQRQQVHNSMYYLFYS